ncbi:MAG: 3-methyl-2-oxobutanoate hydroxymethyltransferase [Lautropia sp.]|nr:MAG: 3-methyl-2-oxobutanoate hydroxymethyltransferase [Pseudomonadota bacterium]MBC6958394.1 3-methyl-2-oxobutanoate hydroxymethyltransferase [Lautropia sp.]MCL4701361.1 3-methyl-2-oxobutanoate hydroxymethyltransferase [Burkholderiaceae bacterium]MDL1909016.1 3-methyl-2-oxobutanoate hydroxymethyltransferase [Betaproteobacteria bacterium PRO1]RIK85845.1 MAG: 3-methyl-2-oxobutanoate hydroxymethyltransferase [Burkholderiales bacterium]
MSAHPVEPVSGTARKPVTQLQLAGLRERGEPIAMLTCYDASYAALLDEVGIECLLIGDSLGMVVQGRESTLPVTLDEVAYHARCVARGARYAWIVADMPFGSYQAGVDAAFANAVRLMQAGAHMVKLEGGAWLAPTIEAMTRAGIPVCAHLGLTPQSVFALGGYRVQGRTPEAADRLITDALALQDAGATMLVLEMVPAALAETVTQRLAIPTIGIGAGPGCSGQVLVLHDMLDVYPGRRPRFVRNFMTGAGSVRGAIEAYRDAVKARSFPGPEHGY